VPWTTNEKIPGQKSKSSPAMAEFRGELHMVHAGDSSNAIWHTVFNGSGWSENETIPDQLSKAPSALASFQNRLHITHLGNSSNRIWHSSFDGTRWTTNEPIDGELSQAAPAMAVFQNALHLLHIGNSSHRIYHLVFDGVEWQRRPDNEGLEDQRSKGPVGLAVFNGELHMVHQGDTSNRLWHSRFDGSRWTENVVIPDQLSKAAPALAALNGLLHLLHPGDSSNRIWHSTFDGTFAGQTPVFAENIPIPYQLSKAAPGLAAFANRLHMTHLGDSSNDIWHSSSDGVLVRRPDRRVVIVDLDGCRWDAFYKHLKIVRDAGASTETPYTFTLPPGASDDTILDDGDVQLRSALGELCFARGNGITDVRLALAAYPSFTFPSHGTMYTGNGPGEHGITGHTFVVRDAPPEWDRHSWDSLPRALALQGYCTDAEGDLGALADYLWGGFDTVDENSCRNRNRGLVSDLRVVNLFERAHEAGLRTCSIHSFYHGAPKPWIDEGKDQWWHYTAAELRSVKDICSDDDLDQLETVDHGALVKADLLLDSMPSKVRVTAPGNLPASIPASTHRMSGERQPGWTVSVEAHPDGIPDLVAIYLASIDHASHLDGIDNQQTYLAWFDHRLARFVRRLREADPEAFENTVFAFVADHGHSRIAEDPDTDGVPSNNSLAVREEIVRIMLGDEEGQEFLDLARTVSQMQYMPSYDWLVSEAIEDDFAAYAEAMNIYVYVRNPDRFSPAEVARRLLSIPMRTEPYGALVLVRGQYQFLARGDGLPVPLTSQRCRDVVSPQLDVPALDVSEIEATSLSDLDRQREESLRQELAANGFGLLRVAERVAAFAPDGINQSPDVILLARAGRSFSKTSGSTHGSFAYPPTRIPMVFCGPGVQNGRTTIDSAQLVDFAPTVLSLLGISRTDGMVGRPLLDGSGRPTTRPEGGAGPKPEPRCPPEDRRPIADRSPRLQRVPRATVVLHPTTVRKPTDNELRGSAPVLVALTLESSRVRRQVTQGEALYVEASRGTALVTGRDDTWMEIGGRRQAIRTGSQIPLDAAPGVRIGSARSFGAIELRRSYVIVPIAIAVPRVPDWLQRALDLLARASRIAIDRPVAKTPGAVLTAADDLEAILRLLDATLTDPYGEEKARFDPRLARVSRRPRSDMEAVQRVVRQIDALLERTVAARFHPPGQMCTQ
jgi:predicted AlkP superfamily pyrophosphatase or phosphodiesterase